MDSSPDNIKETEVQSATHYLKRFGLSGLVTFSVLFSSHLYAEKIMVVGDSLSAGYGIDPSKGWVALLQKKLDSEYPKKHQVINVSVSGETTSGGLARLPKLLKEYQPDITIIELGGNDALRGQPPLGIRNNLNKMVDLSQKSKSKVILFGMKIPPNYGSAYTQAFEQNYVQVSRQYNVALLPFFLNRVAGENQLMQADRVHPNEKAQPILLNNVLPYIKSAL